MPLSIRNSIVAIIAACILALPSLAAATVLSDAAEALAPGSWTQITTTNVGAISQLFTLGPGYDDSSMFWNSKKRTIGHMITEHSAGSTCPNACYRGLVSYSDATNTWSTGGAQPPSSVTYHNYDHVTYDDTNEVLYVRYSNSRQIYRYCYNDFPAHCVGRQGSWTALPLAPVDYVQIAGAIAYHATMDDGSLLFFSGDAAGVNHGELAQFRESTGTWTVLAGSGQEFTNGDYHNLMEYSPVKRVTIFGGGNGSTNIWKIDDDKTVTQLTASPHGINLGATNRSVVADPATGNFVVIFAVAPGQGQLWQLNPDGAGTWTQLDSDLTGTGEICDTFFDSGAGCSGDLHGAAISTYGVIMYWKITGLTTGQVWLYKHSNNDFATRCARSGVVRCVDFNEAADIANTDFGANTGIDTVGASVPVLDSSVKASGASSIKFTIPSNSGANVGGSYWANFSTDLATQFGQNSDFYVQWRQRFSSCYIKQGASEPCTGDPRSYSGAGGWKLVIIGTGDKPGCTASNTTNCYSSCSALETVTQNTTHRGFAQMYNSCDGSTSHGPFDAFEETFGSDFKLQNAQADPYCLYSAVQTDTQFPDTGNCFAFFPDEWMTFTVRIKTGPRVSDEFSDSFVELWIAREGQQSQRVMNWGPYNLTAATAGENQQYGKVWLLPYNTGKSSAESHPTGFTWYDDLIIATRMIEDPALPGASSSTPATPSVPTNFIVKQGA